MEKMMIGDLISAERKRKGLTQQKLADLMGVTDKAVSKWERNLSYPDVASLSRLAEVLEIPLETLLNTADKKENKKEHSEIIDTILKVIPLAMGAAVIVLSVLKQIDVYSGLTLCGIGLFCAGLRNLK